MRMMSFALTERQLMDGTKTVTRRTGWKNLMPGDRLLAVRKAMGLKASEKVQVLCEIEVVAVHEERLDAITPAEVVAEGFPEWADRPADFVAMFCKHMRINKAAGWLPLEKGTRPMTGSDFVTRIEFRKVPGTERVSVQKGLAFAKARTKARDEKEAAVFLEYGAALGVNPRPELVPIIARAKTDA